jgi:hypothetical protein
MCFAVSTTSDAATSGWHLYAFQPAASQLCNGCRPYPDYPKLAVWPDGYYVSYNQGSNGSYIGAAACVLDRNAMLSGAAATMQCFPNSDPSYGSWLPVDLDGTTPPPAGTPGYFLNFDANDQSLDLWQLHVDWTTPANSTFTGPINIPVTPFTEACGETLVELNYSSTYACVPQAQTAQMLDSYGDRLMYRAAYRNFGNYASLVANHTVTVGTSSSQTGIRWYELRDSGSGFAVYQQGTYAPDSTSYRWMGSIAMDHVGNIALGYSVSDSGMSPSIRYTGRLPTDALGQMESEVDVLSSAGVANGSQTQTYRWADYSSMAIDPSDDCTFWYTTEYIPTTGGAWATRISSFSFPSCTNPTLTVTLAGAGTGTVTSTPAGINCPTQCSSSFLSGTSVTLSATAASGSVFGGWNGPCTGTAACILSITSGQTVGANFSVGQAPDFTVTPSPTAATVSPGGTASFTVQVTALGGFSGAVTLSCSAPAAPGVSCSFSPASVNPGSSAGLMVATTGPSAALGSPPRSTRPTPPYGAGICLLALALGTGSAGLSLKKRRLAGLLLCSALLTFIVFQMACGNSSGGSKGGGTPAGTYTVNFTATSGTIQHGSSVSVTVQ